MKAFWFLFGTTKKKKEEIFSKGGSNGFLLQMCGFKTMIVSGVSSWGFLSVNVKLGFL